MTVIGVGLSITAFLVGGTMLLLQLWSPTASVYTSLLTLVVTPSLIGGGVGIALLGIFLQYRVRKRSGGKQQFLPFDAKRQLRLWPVWAVGIVVFLTVSAYGGYSSFEFVEGKEFCGLVCHKVMHPEYMAHSNSPHARVACITCHAGPGIEHQIKVKIRGVHQLVAIVTGEYKKPIATPLQHLRPAKDICVQCHWPQKFIGMTVQDHTYFLPDEQNSPRRLKLLMHVGGGQLDTDSVEKQKPSIHWHVSSPSKVYYVATDDHRQEIKWVKLVDGQGRQVTYKSADLDMSEADLMTKHEVRQMDCIDCHNRAVHVFKPPERLINNAMLAGQIDPSLPFVKKKSIELLRGEYASGEEARPKIVEALVIYYKTSYPELATSKRAAIERAGATLADLYATNIFPTMKADWRAHADNIGHTFSKGCFRCHSGNLKDSEGHAISSACETCHDFAAQGKGLAEPPLVSPQAFIHPGEIDEDLWKGSACTDCHTGAGTDQ